MGQVHVGIWTCSLCEYLDLVLFSKMVNGFSGICQFLQFFAIDRIAEPRGLRFAGLEAERNDRIMQHGHIWLDVCAELRSSSLVCYFSTVKILGVHVGLFVISSTWNFGLPFFGYIFNILRWKVGIPAFPVELWGGDSDHVYEILILKTINFV